MAINLKRTSDAHANGVKMLVYGQAGAGKTTLIKTLPNVIVLSAESGILSLQDADLPYLEITDMESLMEAYDWLMNDPEGQQFQSIALDSISEIAEIVLNTEKKKTVNGKLVDPRQAYGSLAESMTDMIRAFRDIPGRNVYFTSKVEKTTDEMGKVFYGPSMPGKTLTQGVAYFFDLVLALRVEKDSEGNTQRAIMTDSDGLWLAKDRSGKLDAWETADLGAIIAKIGGVK